MHTPAPALITGAASGIGLATARQLAAAGHRLLLVDRDPVVRQVAAQLPCAGEPHQGHVVDLASLEQVRAVAAHARDAFGGCGILVNNAGMNIKKAGGRFELQDIPTEDWELVMRVNTTAPFLLCRELMPSMRQRRWGRVVNIASRAGRTYIPSVTLHYATSKAALIGMTRQLAGEFAADGITVNCVAPGPVDTALSRQNNPEVAARLRAAVPAGRSGTAEEIAATVCFLVSAQAAFIAGACIDVNGGAFMG